MMRETSFVTAAAGAPLAIARFGAPAASPPLLLPPLPPSPSSELPLLLLLLLPASPSPAAALGAPKSGSPPTKMSHRLPRGSSFTGRLASLPPPAAAVSAEGEEGAALSASARRSLLR